MKRIVFINSHPIQYFVPLYRQIAQTEADSLDLTVLYLTDETVNGYHDRQFGAHVAWDLPMLEGYRHKFLQNHSWKPSLYNGFFGLINWGLIGELRRMPKSIVISHGWAYASNLIALLAARLFGHTVCLRGDNPISHEAFKHPASRFRRNLFLRFVVFPLTHALLPVGRQNRQLYASLGVPERAMISVPHAVDNARFQQQCAALRGPDVPEPFLFTGRRVILYVGKLIDKKRPFDLLNAYRQLAATYPDVALMFVGDGPLRDSLEAAVRADAVANVCITGFVNQGEIARYYAGAAVFVMCSGPGETWGLAVNEAMNFALPIVVSDLTGCADDLVEPGVNGYVFPTGNVPALASAIARCLDGHVSGQASLDRIRAYSYEAMIQGLKTSPVRP